MEFNDVGFLFAWPVSSRLKLDGELSLETIWSDKSARAPSNMFPSPG